MSSDNHIVKVPQDLEELIPIFLENRHKDVQYLKQALIDHNHHAISRIGHSIKGTAGSYGFSELSKIGQHLEEAAENQHNEQEQLLIQQLEQLLNTITIRFE